MLWTYHFSIVKVEITNNAHRILWDFNDWLAIYPFSFKKLESLKVKTQNHLYLKAFVNECPKCIG